MCYVRAQCSHNFRIIIVCKSLLAQFSLRKSCVCFSDMAHGSNRFYFIIVIIHHLSLSLSFCYYYYRIFAYLYLLPLLLRFAIAVRIYCYRRMILRSRLLLYTQYTFTSLLKICVSASANSLIFFSSFFYL